MSELFSRESWHYGVMRPDFVLVEGMTEDEARAYVERGNADGSTRYSLCRRPVGPWENLTNLAPHICTFLVADGVMLAVRLRREVGGHITQRRLADSTAGGVAAVRRHRGVTGAEQITALVSNAVSGKRLLDQRHRNSGPTCPNCRPLTDAERAAHRAAWEASHV